MKTYTQQHEPWRPDYPPVWNDVCYSDDGGAYRVNIFDRLEPSESLTNLRSLNILAFTTARSAIDKAMKQ
jgi:hypothetical protein